jgi:hypothetical protein
MSYILYTIKVHQSNKNLRNENESIFVAKLAFIKHYYTRTLLNLSVET